MKKIHAYIKKHKFLTFVFIIFLFYNIFPDIFEEKRLKTYLGSRIYVYFQDLTPREAKKLIVEEANKNPLYMNHDNDRVWTRMFVCGDEYFFPVRWPKESINEEGYYINPKTRKIRHVDNDYYFFFPLFFDRISIKLPPDNKE